MNLKVCKQDEQNTQVCYNLKIGSFYLGVCVSYLEYSDRHLSWQSSWQAHNLSFYSKIGLLNVTFASDMLLT